MPSEKSTPNLTILTLVGNAVVGNSTGDLVGFGVGDSVGFLVGEMVGLSVGELVVGFLVGLTVGDSVGRLVGGVVGSLVGLTVGDFGSHGGRGRRQVTSLIYLLLVSLFLGATKQ